MRVSALLAGLSLSLGLTPPPPTSETAMSRRVVAAFIARSTPALASYRGRRHLSAATRGGRMHASLVADTELDERGVFRFRIVEQQGSRIMIARVLLAALQQERDLRDDGRFDQGALTGENYVFDVPTSLDTLTGEICIGLTARRRDRLLLDGAMFLAADDFDLTRVEGTLARPPSRWTRRVRVVRRYQRVNGVRVPVEAESVAHVRVVGPSHLTMTYTYTMVNGRLVQDAR